MPHRPLLSATALRDALALAFLVFAAARTSFWVSAAEALLPPDYAQTRIARAFQGLPIDAIRERLDALLPPAQAVALSPVLLENHVLVQRLTEGLYPRRIDRTATATLDARLASEPPAAGPAGPALGRFREAEIFLRSPLPGVAEPPRGPPSEAFLLWPYLGSIAGALGLGLALRALLERVAPLEPSLGIPASVLLAALAFGVEASLATVVQRPLGARALPWVGLLCAAAAAVRAGLRGDPGARLGAVLRSGLRRPEGALLAALVAILFLRAATGPLWMGDGRSIWLFQAKRLFTHGFVPLTELRHPDSLWSHPDYPLLFPASLAQLAALHGAFDERLAATAIPLLLGACLGALWLLAREALGRTAGAAFTLGLALSLDRLATGGYADGFLALLLLVQFLAVVSGGRDAIAWIAAACASLVKGEGILLALPVAVLFTVARIRKEGRISWRGLAPWLCLLPGPAYTLWIRAQGVDTVLKDKAAGAIASELPARLARAFAEAPLPFLVQGYTELRDLLWSGALALAVSMALLALRRGGRRQGRLALVVAATWTGMAFVAVSVPPEDVGWFVRTALDRLLAAPAALLVLAPLLLLAGDPVPSRAEGLPGER